ncbi:MAG: hypothetical protein EP307_00605 [Rhodobacteraceae bacterium]|nr:MAG: hypothetical protein EP307_00605 [Paracoccaceae bacterium]
MKPKFGPTKSDLRFRLAFSLAGLALLVGGILYRGIPHGPAFFEVIGVAGAFFGGTAIWTLRKLVKGEYSDGL